MLNRTISLILVLLLGVCFACGGGEEKNTKPSKPAPKPKVEEPPPPSFSDNVRSDAKIALDAVMKCRAEHLANINMDAYRKGDVEAFGVDFNAMDNACEPAISVLTKRLNELVVLDSKLDIVFLHASLFRDCYVRVSNFAKRIGDKRRKMTKKNAKRLERFLADARAASDDLKASVAALDGRNFEDASGFIPARAAFLTSLSGRFDAYVEKPVKAKTAMYHRTAKFLVAGTSRIHKRARNASTKHKQAMGKLVRTLQQVRALYEDYLMAYKSKSKPAKEIKKLCKQALDGLKP
jgi:hypothetical protein